MTLPLSISGLKVSIGQRTLLSIPKFTAPAGSLIGVRGPSGAGKSTLLHALSGLLPCTGQLQWGETDIARLSNEERAKFRATHLGMIFQDFLLFDELSPQSNASMAALFSPSDRRDKISTRARDYLERLSVPREARRTASFSGGERQRVAVARALSTDPGILLADEPTASLDRATADGLIKDLVAVVRQSRKTLIVASHDLHFLGQLDRVVLIEDGCLQPETDEVPT